MRRLLVIAVALLAACNDNGAPMAPGATTPSPVPAPSGGWLRVASLSADLAGAEVRLDGSTFRASLGYPQVTGYRRIEPGSHRLRFIPPARTPVDERTVQLELPIDVAEGRAMTVVSSGLVETRTLTLTAFPDEIMPSGEGAGLRLIHAMSDFPAPLELWLRAGSPLLRNVAHLEDQGYRAVTRGNYPLEIRRQGTTEPLVPVDPQGLAGSATYTMFAFGTLRNGDLDAFLVLDGSLGSPALRVGVQHSGRTSFPSPGGLHENR